MAKRTSIATAFNPSAGTVDASGIAGLNPALVLVILNTTAASRGPIYDPLTPGMGFASVSGQVMHLEFDTSGQSSIDTVMIIWDDGLGSQSVAPVAPRATSSALGSLTAKSSAGSLVGFRCASASAAWALFYDATSAPGDGATTPILAEPLYNGVATARLGDAPLGFQNGLTLVFSSTGPFLKTSGPTGFLSAQVL